MELTRLNSIKSAPILLTPFCLFLGPLETEWSCSISSPHVSIFIIAYWHWTGRLPGVDGCSAVDGSGWNGDRDRDEGRTNTYGDWWVAGKHIIDILWLEIHGKTIKRVTGLLHARVAVEGSTSRLTVWLSFPIYPMRYLRLMCLKVNTMRHTGRKGEKVLMEKCLVKMLCGKYLSGKKAVWGNRKTQLKCRSLTACRQELNASECPSAIVINIKRRHRPSTGVLGLLSTPATVHGITYHCEMFAIDKLAEVAFTGVQDEGSTYFPFTSEDEAGHTRFTESPGRPPPEIDWNNKPGRGVANWWMQIFGKFPLRFQGRGWSEWMN